MRRGLRRGFGLDRGRLEGLAAGGGEGPKGGPPAGSLVGPPRLGPLPKVSRARDVVGPKGGPPLLTLFFFVWSTVSFVHRLCHVSQRGPEGLRAQFGVGISPLAQRCLEGVGLLVPGWPCGRPTKVGAGLLVFLNAVVSLWPLHKGACWPMGFRR